MYKLGIVVVVLSVLALGFGVYGVVEKSSSEEKRADAIAQMEKDFPKIPAGKLESATDSELLALYSIMQERSPEHTGVVMDIMAGRWQAEDAAFWRNVGFGGGGGLLLLGVTFIILGRKRKEESTSPTAKSVADALQLAS